MNIQSSLAIIPGKMNVRLDHGNTGLEHVSTFVFTDTKCADGSNCTNDLYLAPITPADVGKQITVINAKSPTDGTSHDVVIASWIGQETSNPIIGCDNPIFHRQTHDFWVLSGQMVTMHSAFDHNGQGIWIITECSQAVELQS